MTELDGAWRLLGPTGSHRPLQRLAREECQRGPDCRRCPESRWLSGASLANAVGIVKVVGEEGADTVLMPVSAREQLCELSEYMAIRINIQFYSDPPDAMLKALLE